MLPEFHKEAMIMNLDRPAIRELSSILRERGVSRISGMNISLMACEQTRAMIDWLKENPSATEKEMAMKAVELGRM